MQRQIKVERISRPHSDVAGRWSFTITKGTFQPAVWSSVNFDTLPSLIVVNSWQLAVIFADYLLLAKEDNHQADALFHLYQEIFPVLRNFQPDEGKAGNITSFMNDLQWLGDF
ncbi:hypothetical protein NQZ79_g7349 [Umbelopsis isabellina]|nr:hypothetical protein NQZ79_g7349 [Umbelopsis isabellina]